MSIQSQMKRPFVRGSRLLSCERNKSNMGKTSEKNTHMRSAMNLSSSVLRNGRFCLIGLGTVAALSVPLPTAADSLWKTTYSPDKSFIADLGRAEQRFSAAETLAIGDPTRLTDYAQAGITLSDFTCDAWLQTLGRSDRDTGFFKDILNIVGNLILGISGINGANPTSLARGALGLSAANASIDAFRNEIILGTISDIEEKLKDGRRISAAFFVAHVPGNFDEAKRRLFEYHDGCSPVAIKTLLKAGLAQVKYVAPDTSLATPIDLANADILASTLYSLMYKPGDVGAVGVPSDDTLYRLYVTQIAYPSDSSSELIKNTKLDANLVSVAKVFKDKNDKGQLAPLLQRIAELRGYPKRLQADLAKEKADKANMQAKADVDAAEKAVADAKTVTEAARSKVEVATKDKTPPEQNSAQSLMKSFSSTIKPLNNSIPSLTGVEEVRKEADSHAKAFDSQAAIDLNAKLGDLSEKVKVLDALRVRERALRSVVQPSAAPASISAIIVPVNK